MTRFASLRFERLLDDRDRENAARAVGSCGARVLSWANAAGESFALIAVAAGTAGAEAARAAGALADDPPLLLLRAGAHGAAALGELEAALTGPGRPAGIRLARRVDGAVELAVDAQVTAPDLILATASAALGQARPASIEALLPLDDALLAQLAAGALGEPDLDASRVVESYVA